jgi:hypothetical protein
MSKGQQKSFVVAGDAYAKMVMHINKYPYLAVNGVLLGSNSNGDAAIRIVDYIPFFHGATLAPMLEAAMTLVHAILPLLLHPIDIVCGCSIRFHPQVEERATEQQLSIGNHHLSLSSSCLFDLCALRWLSCSRLSHQWGTSMPMSSLTTPS